MRLFILMLILMLIGSCNNQNHDLSEIVTQFPDADSIKVIDISTIPIREITNISGISMGIEYIPLEKGSSSKIDVIDKIVTTEGRLYVGTLNEVFCYDKEGHFICNASRGNKNFKEPEDIIYDFDVSSDDSILAILSNKKILVFSNTGAEFNYLRTINLKEPFPSKISFVPDSYNILISLIPSRGSERSLSIIINPNGDTLTLKPNFYRFIKHDKISYGNVEEIVHYKTDNCLCFKEEFSDTVFYFDNQSLEYKPRLILDTQGKTIKRWMRGNSPLKNSYDSVYSVQRIFEVSRYFVYSFEISTEGSYSVLLDKVTNESFKIDLHNGLTDDITGGPDLYLNICSDGKFYSWMSSVSLHNHLKEEKFMRSDLTRKEQLKDILSPKNEHQNPVLIVITPKEMDI
ncbi:MAG: 6-bladed beta-propeller [Bacteroidales bacterium]|nr:6-bladed beta-propeller [Bacteroidales bacterium]